MDLHCVVCGEPWDLDELHYVEGKTFSQARSDFALNGCDTFGCGHSEHVDSKRAQASALLHDLLGDDVDGIASMMEDADYLGMLD